MTQEHIIERRGLMFVLSSPSGAGKTTITRALLEKNDSLHVSVSATTRPRRAGEVHGQDYYFIDIPTFDKMVANGEMLEHAKVFGNYYGTPKEPVEEALSEGKDIIFDIDWQGTQQLKQVIQDDLVSVFILPPSHKDLEKRLRNRSLDTKESEEQIKDRMSKAADEISHFDGYDYVIINDDINLSITQAQTILDAERMKRHRMKGLSSFAKGLMDGI